MNAPWVETVARARELRHQLHRRPELGWAEHSTAAVVRAELDAIGIGWRACAGTGTVGLLAEGASGRHVALRADLDAMPITEVTGLPYASRADGVMHACGHDGHTATLLAVARWLQAHESDLPGPVTLLFQPAEEGGHGARGMIDDGAFDGVDVVFGWHNWPGLPLGRALCPDGAVMSANGVFEVELRGRGGHASQPEATRDPVLAAAAVTVALQQIVARRTAPQEAVVVAVTSLHADSAPTVTPERAALGGSVRAADDAARARVFALIEEIAGATASAHGVHAHVRTVPRYGATVNHPGPAAELRERLSTVLGSAWTEPAVRTPVLASEDFSYYLQQVPGAFALLGSGTCAPLHSPDYDFDDALLDPAARLLLGLAGAPEPP
ncbi:N(2)-acetyl-L-2,4-diaminobutanoate deacetylase DoeB2 [Tsukamurella sp. PLM1]|uniref:N(2)-acetyl-L-2,4-diaminobutanoate deacetylase DoeB2 n=1 Tax=Tsukamurella sp. PLM1 TaxID=2929795 RepID=UPI00205F5888|nr:N(2)-acetyl-L-2,4-diaminobutanoate deacetylase DoeB2 [Tsukamurella sp. PLM1]BDH59693.1 peptidase [Tsukamurella sp. PLM1]